MFIKGKRRFLSALSHPTQSKIAVLKAVTVWEEQELSSSGTYHSNDVELSLLTTFNFE